MGVFLSSNIVFLIICYFIYGISSALDTGSIDAFIVNKLSQENNKEQLIKKFISYNNGFMLLAMIIGATTGIFLYQLIDGVIYLISATSFIILAFFVFCFFDKEIKSESNITIRSQFKKTFAVFNYKEGIFIFILIIILQFPLQAIMQYWQILLKQINFNIQYNSIFYSLILFSTALFSYIFKFVNIKEKLLPIFMLIYLIAGLFFFLNNVIVMAIVFFIVTLANTFIMLFYNNKIQNAISSKQRSTITSTISFFGRIVSMVAMLVLTLFNRILNNPFSAFATVIFIGAISLFIVFFILQTRNSRQKVAFDANLDYKIPYHINLVTNYKKSAFKLLVRMLNF